MLESYRKSKIHFIGIGGIGMSGIADVLLSRGFKVSGSDAVQNALTDSLSKKGAEIFIGHHETNLNEVGCIVYSTAINTSNPEIIRAKKDNIPLVRRAQMLAEIMKGTQSIAIAGSHGKTTTSGMVSTIFQSAGKDPTFVVGGIISNLGTNALSGEGTHFIAEADESDGSFLLLHPKYAAITNIDNDHLDHYKNEEKIKQAFVEFINDIPGTSPVVLNAADTNTQSILPMLTRSYVQFGMNADDKADYLASDIVYCPGRTEFKVSQKKVELGQITINVSGMHNVMNAMAAISISLVAGITFKDIQKGLLLYKGMGRRLESLWKHASFEVLDDYGHHPTEIRATLKTLKDVFKKTVCVVFEPHRYTRTQQHWNEFAFSFSDADEVFVSPIYAASENAIEGINSEKLVEAISKNQSNAKFLQDLSQMKSMIADRKEKDVVFLTLGAGSISKKIREIVKTL